jgi:hypothetical protein
MYRKFSYSNSTDSNLLISEIFPATKDDPLFQVRIEADNQQRYISFSKDLIRFIFDTFELKEFNITQLIIHLEYLRIESLDINNIDIINLEINFWFSNTTVNHLHVITPSKDTLSLTSYGSNLKNISIMNSSLKNINLFNTKTNSLTINETTIDILNLESVIFDDILKITKTRISQLKFINCIFDKFAIINNSVFTKSVDIFQCIFNKSSSFNLHESVGVCSSSTLRLLKEASEKQYNKIEANKFHALELSKKREELNDEVKSNFKQFNFSKLTQLLPDWLIFSLHGITSNHSQSWVLPIYWIIILSLFGATFEYGNIALSGIPYSLLMIPFFAMHFIGVFNQKIFKPLVFILGFSTAFYFYYVFNNFSMANVFKYLENSFQFSGSDIHGFHYVFNKAIIAYLTYQFILGVRKDTRR